jgi:hypothetical protein
MQCVQWLIPGSRKTPSPHPLASSHKRCGALHETLARVSVSSIGPVEQETASPFVDCASKRIPRQRFTAMRLTAAALRLLFVSTAMSSSTHGCGADVPQSSRRCRIPHMVLNAQGTRDTRTMSPVTERGCPTNRLFRVSGFRVYGDPARCKLSQS